MRGATCSSGVLMRGQSCIFNPVEVCLRAEVKRVVEGCGRGHEAVWQSVLADLRKFPTRFDDNGFALFAADVDIPVGVNGRRGVISTDAFAPDFNSGFGFE